MTVVFLLFPSFPELLETAAVHEFSVVDAMTMTEVRAAGLGFRLEWGREGEMRSLYEMLLCLLFVFQWTNILPLLKRSMDTIWSR